MKQNWLKDFLRTPDPSNPWAFLSHSHLDVEPVRKVRGFAERFGLQPLMFFLRCLDDDSEVDDLIKREIEARDWFVLCDSPNSRRSNWVRTEVEHISRLPDKFYVRVDLGAPDEQQREQLHALSKRLTVFLAYDRGASDAAAELAHGLRRRGYRVLPDARQLRGGDVFASAVGGWIADAMQEGFVLPVVAQTGEEGGTWFMQEVEHALSQQAEGSRNIIPIFTGPVVEAPLALQRIQGFQWSQSSDFESSLDALVRVLKTAEMD